MRLNPQRRGRRGGFTLVEILVVIVIIGVLASLTVAGAWKALAAAKRAAARTEIGQLEVAITNFKSQYNVPYIPSRIWLDESGAYDYSTARPVSATPLSNPQLDALKIESVSYLQRVFGRHLAFRHANNQPIMDFNGDGAGNTNVVLEGHQCLVFFLGGMDGTLGFSSNPQNPTDRSPASSAAPRKGPFFEFDPSRLIRVSNSVPFASYKDNYGGNVYAYFSSYTAQNNYNRYGVSDCASLSVEPYYDVGAIDTTKSPAVVVPQRYLKPNDYQIICAGPDGKFGPLSARVLELKTAGEPDTSWTVKRASNVWPTGSIGHDDQGNFYDSTLGTSTE